MGYKCLTCGNTDRFYAETDFQKNGTTSVIITDEGEILEELDYYTDETEYDYNFYDFDLKCERCNSHNVGNENDELEPYKPKTIGRLIDEV